MISISDTRTLGRAKPSINYLMVGLIEIAERLQVAHELECGCPQPGELWTGCTWRGPAADLLNQFHFDEELVG